MRVEHTALDWSTGLAEQFDDLPQQRESATLGMWIFLGTEILMFGGLFTGYAAYRVSFSHAFEQGSRHLYTWIGVTNTAVLLISSLCVAIALHAMKHGNHRSCARNLLAAIVLGIVFLALKGIEYWLDIHDGLLPWYHLHLKAGDAEQVRLFLIFYWFMTGLHALHMLVGITVLSIIALLARAGHYSAEWHSPVEIAGLYWHFVDIVWIFLLPTLYLIQPVLAR